MALQRGWPTGVIDGGFPRPSLRYAGAMADHFQGLVNHYSPHNEPGSHACSAGWWAAGRHTRRQSRVRPGSACASPKEWSWRWRPFRQILPNAVIVSVDPFFYALVDRHLPPAASDDAARRQLLRAATSYPGSLAYGKVTPDHPFAGFLRDHGVGEADVAWFQGRARKPDILGVNCYPSMRLPPPAKKTTPSPEQIARQKIAVVKHAILNSQTYFNLPVYLTETSDGLTDEAKIAYINGLYDLVRDLRREKVPIVGVNWWPLFDTIQWDYRENPAKPLRDFIYPGGWNNGLYKIDPQANGDLKRVPTRAVRAFQKVLRRDMP